MNLGRNTSQTETDDRNQGQTNTLDIIKLYYYYGINDFIICCGYGAIYSRSLLRAIFCT